MAKVHPTTGSPAPQRREGGGRKLGTNEMFCNTCQAFGNLNVMCGLTLLTRHAVDEGLMKCAMQEFQHMYPQLTSRILSNNSIPHFSPMECPILPLDIAFQTRDMLHDKFDIENGPLWRVQLITEATMDQASLGFGPELEAIIEDDSSTETRWRYFLRYFQGKLNQEDVENFDDANEGFRSFILMTFHPSITDTLGSFHLLRQFLQILDVILEQDSSSSVQVYPQEGLHAPIEALLPTTENSFQITDLFPMAKAVGSFMMPRKSAIEDCVDKTALTGQPYTTEVLRGWLNQEETAELIAMMEEDDASLHGVILASGLIALSRIIQSDKSREYPPSETMYLRATNEHNLRQYCPGSPKHGCLSTYLEEDYTVPPVTDRTEFWRFAHELTIKLNTTKGSRQPLKMLRVYNKMFSYGGKDAFKDMDKNTKLQNEMGVSVYGDLGNLFRRETSVYPSLDSWNKPFSATQRNIRLEDVYHAVAAQNMGSPFTHSAHILHGRLNYLLSYYSTYVDQRLAFMVRDETINILRMATDKT